MELTMINNALTAAVVLVDAQRLRISSGDRKNPPPTTTSHDTNPKPAPTARLRLYDGGL